MSDPKFSSENIKALLMSMATGHAVRRMVEHLVVGDLPFEDKEVLSSWPCNRMDGLQANYYSFFKKDFPEEIKFCFSSARILNFWARLASCGRLRACQAWVWAFCFVFRRACRDLLFADGRA